MEEYIIKYEPLIIKNYIAKEVKLINEYLEENNIDISNNEKLLIKIIKERYQIKLDIINKILKLNGDISVIEDILGIDKKVVNTIKGSKKY